MSDNPKVLPVQGQPRGVNIEKVLQEYAKLHLELNILAEENLTLKQALGGIQQQAKDEIAKRDTRITELETAHAEDKRIAAIASFEDSDDPRGDEERVSVAGPKLATIRS